MTGRLSAPEISGQLEKILADPLFSKSERLGGFLRFVVESEVAGRGSDLKEYTIGVHVYKRGEGYDPKQDPIVRIMAGRLRAKLAEYYIGSGAADGVLIDLPRGGYVPRFTWRVRETARAATEARPVRSSVGRLAEMKQIREAFEFAASGHGLVVCVPGDAGMGKTTFVEDFLAELEQAGTAYIARGRCSERLAETDAFAPILDALDSLPRTGGAAALRSSAPAWHSQLAGPGKDGKAKAASHERMRREFVALFEDLSATKPVVLFLDDLHWADASTCDLLVYLGQRMRNIRVMIIATYRPGAVLSAGHPFVPFHLRLQQSGLAREVRLALLGQAEVEEYIGRVFPGNRFPPELASIVHERTEGHPLFLSDLMRYLTDSQILQHQGEWRLVRSTAEVRRVIPAGTHATIGVMLGHLVETDREILLCAAVQGMQFDSAVVAEALSADPVVVEEKLRSFDRVDRLISVVDEQDRPGLPLSVRYRFVHVFYQNALYASLTPSRRAERSLAVAGVLAGLAGESSRAIAAELAVLYESGRDYGNASQYFLHAARNAARVFAHPEAALLCERGLKSLRTLPESGQRDEQELLFTLTLGMALMSTRGYAAPEVEQTYRRSRELCLKLKEIRRLVPVLWAIHTCDTNAGRLTQALTIAHEMRQAADALGTKEAIVESLHALGTTLMFMGRLAEAREALEHIFKIAPVDQHEFRGSLYVLDPLVTSLSMLGRLLILMGEPERAMARAREAVDLANRLAHPHSLTYATFWVGWVLHTQGRHTEAYPHLESAMAMGRNSDLPLIVEWGRVVLGSALAQLGRREEGVAEIRKSIERQDAMGSKLERPYCLTLLAEALTGGGEWGEAIRLCDQALDLAAATEGRSFEPETHRVRAEAILSAHGESRREEAAAALRNALRLARETGNRLFESRAESSYRTKPFLRALETASARE